MDLNEIINNWEEIIINSKSELDKAIEHAANLIEVAESEHDISEAKKVAVLVNKRLDQVDRVQLAVKSKVKELALLMHHYKGELND